MTRDATTAALDTLNWLARLPFLAVDELALLTGLPEPDIEAVLRQFQQDGHVDWITPSSPELDASRRYVLTEPARCAIVSGQRTEPKAVRLPLDWREILHRLTALEATVALNAFAADLVTALRRHIGAELEDFWSLPRVRPEDAWWPPGVHGFGSIRVGTVRTPFFVFVDRAGAPPAHRATLIAGWYRFREGRQIWGHGELPPILILCPGTRWEEAWTRHVLASADRRGLPTLPVLLASRQVLDETPDGPHWRRVDDSDRASLIERLAGRSRSEPRQPVVAQPFSCPPVLTARATRLYGWASGTLQANNPSRLERLAALSLTTSAAEKRILDCLGRHPLLTEEELMVALKLQRRIPRHAIERALRKGLIVAHGKTAAPFPRYCLRTTALELLAARDEVPVRRYARRTTLTALPREPGNHLPTLLQQFEHTVGVNSFFVSWLRCRPNNDARLVAWLNAAESAVRIESAGSFHWLRPDGSGTVLAGRYAHDFLLEWDRATERIPVLAMKLARYAEFYHAQHRSGSPLPALLFVTTTPQREELVRHLSATTLSSFDQLVLTTCASLVQRLGPRAPIWRTQANQPRTAWPIPTSDRNQMEDRS
ncbi:MAG: replication-relaxation family protein [Dehalococcoidia bacterium]|nr:replication-relaxation family protein [Dehalococcoidia bacterium]